METLDQRVSHIEGKIDSLATKEDVANLRADMAHQLSNHRADVAQQLANQRAESKEMETRLIKWMVGTVLAGIAVATSLAISLQNVIAG